MALCCRVRDLYLISVGRVIFLMRLSRSGSVRMRVLVRWKWYLRMQYSQPADYLWWQCSVIQNLVIF
jgi:hypothetical protein